MLNHNRDEWLCIAVSILIITWKAKAAITRAKTLAIKLANLPFVHFSLLLFIFNGRFLNLRPKKKKKKKKLLRITLCSFLLNLADLMLSSSPQILKYIRSSVGGCFYWIISRLKSKVLTEFMFPRRAVMRYILKNSTSVDPKHKRKCNN